LTEYVQFFKNKAKEQKKKWAGECKSRLAMYQPVVLWKIMFVWTTFE
jgi:hypothetical protein